MPGNRAVEQRNRVIGLLLMPIAFFVLISLVTYSANDYPNSSLRPDEVLNAGGRAGAMVASVLFLVCGYGSYGIPVIIAFWGWNRLRNRNPRLLIDSLVSGLLIIITGVTTVSLITTLPADLRFLYGGALGFRTGQLAYELFGKSGAFYASVMACAGSIVLPVVWGVRRRSLKRRAASRIPDDEEPSVSRSPLA